MRCAELLQRAGFDTLILEAADAPGGRVRTDVVDGFHLDRGFQVLLTAYPETRAALNYRALKLRKFTPGAMVWYEGRFHRFSDPWREPINAAKFLFDDVVTFGDKWRIALLRARVSRGEPDALFQRPDQSTHQFLRRFGFSAKMIDRFFAPFFGGVFLESELQTSSRYFEFLFRMFAGGATAVPAEGMEGISRQLAGKLEPGTLELNTEVVKVVKRQQRFLVTTAHGDEIEAKQMVFAVAEHALRPLLADLLPHTRAQGREQRNWNCTTTFYYAAATSPIKGPILALNGEGPDGGPINNLVVMSQVSRRYAPRGQELIAVSVVGYSPANDAEMQVLEGKVREHAERWFGEAVVQTWRFVGAYPIDMALPLARTSQWEASATRVTDNVYTCSDAQETPSLQGALASGRRAAEAILAQRGWLLD
ncbi:FAD-dependent oxidoreductase [Acidipila sp. EB88]|nr:FAD-dependent oxidoreductase [Acidipila sp. EB88]